MKKSFKSTTAIIAIALTSLSLAACDGLNLDTLLSGGDGPKVTTPLSTSAPTSAELVAEAKGAIGSIETLAKRPNPGGYERSCKEGKGCVFGPNWTDDQEAPLGHNGCDTRNDVLAQQLTNVKYKGTSDCVVVGGTYTEPYFGTTEEFIKGEPQAEQDEIDHIYPLSLGWDTGMNTLDMETRKQFANDAEYNLVITTNSANASGNDANGDGKYNARKGEYPGKSDKAAYEWLPYLTDTGRACDYSARYVLTAHRYGLPILEADKTAIQEAFSRC